MLLDVYKLGAELVVDIVAAKDLRAALAARFALYSEKHQPVREKKRSVTPV